MGEGSLTWFCSGTREQINQSQAHAVLIQPDLTCQLCYKCDVYSYTIRLVTWAGQQSALLCVLLYMVLHHLASPIDGQERMPLLSYSKNTCIQYSKMTLTLTSSLRARKYSKANVSYCVCFQAISHDLMQAAVMLLPTGP